MTKITYRVGENSWDYTWTSQEIGSIKKKFESIPEFLKKWECYLQLGSDYLQIYFTNPRETTQRKI